MTRRRLSLLALLTALAALLFFGGLIASSVLDMRRQLSNLGTADSDVVQWSLSQIEVDALKLENAVLRAHHYAPPQRNAALHIIRRRFDLYFSRAEPLILSDNFASVRMMPGIGPPLDEIRAFLDTWTPVIDGPDAELEARLAELEVAAGFNREAARRATLRGIALSAAEGDNQRSSISRTLSGAVQHTLVLVSILFVMLALMLRLDRMRDRQTRQNRETQARMETIVETSFDAVIVIDTAGRILDFNGAAETAFGIARDAALGAELADLIIPPDQRDAHRAGMRRYLSGRRGRMLERGTVQLDAQRSNGQIFPVELSLSEAQLPTGPIFIAFLRDISDRVAAENALRSARDEAIAGAQSKARMLAVMSHEMRTPLNGIIGALELLDPKALPADQRHYLDINRNSAHRLLDLVNDVLEISRMDAGGPPVRARAFDLVALLQDLCDSQIGPAQARGNTIVLTPPSPVLHQVWGDPERLRQALLNLLGNAIKFTENGQITVEAECTNGLSEVELRVIDSGQGIAPEDLDRVFDDFVTLDGSYQRRHEGTGLGLGIAQRLTLAMGGMMGVESEPGEGSVFWVCLPLARPAGAEDTPEITAPHDPAATAPLRILLIEDNDINRLVLCRMLEADTHHVTQADNGLSGVHLAQTQPFDLILMDISMPGMDGVTATEHIRQGGAGALNRDTPILPVTAHALPEDLQRFREAGMGDSLIKPITRSTLRAALADISDPTLAQPSASRPSQGDTPPVLSAELIDTLNETLTPQHRRAAMRSFAHEIDRFLDGQSLFGDPASPPDLTLLAQEAHRLCGAAGLFGAPRLAALLGQLQEAAQKGEADALLSFLPKLRPCWAETRKALLQKGLLQDS